MKAIRNLLRHQAALKPLLLIIAFLGCMSAQAQLSISGKLIDKETNRSIPYAYVSLLRSTDSTLVVMVVSDTSGIFNIPQVSKGSYRLKISVLGYQPVSRALEVGSNNFDSGTLFLQSNTVTLNEAVVVGERMKAKAERDKTTFFISKKMTDASNNGTDVLKLIPGIQVDLMQNISVEGNSNILILVDGQERDKNFVSQINPEQIEKVEVISAPPSKYDASYSRALNIVMKKERESGISGQLNPEIPVSRSLIFVHPSFNLNYGFKKINLYASYIGEMIYADQDESRYRKISDVMGISEFKSDQFVRQNYWSHRVNYGFDYFLNPKNQVNFYAFYNPYSQELNGMAGMEKIGDTNGSWKAQKADRDMNRTSYYSIYFKHIFNTKGNELIFDLNNYQLKANNVTTFTSENSDVPLVSSVKPRQIATSLKVDYNAFPGKNISFSTGLKARIQTMHDAGSNDFNYSEKLFAAYGSFGFKYSKLDMNFGLRVENSNSDLDNKFTRTFLSVLPYGALNYKISSTQNIQLTYKRSINRPNIYQLDPTQLTDDPYSIHFGNPSLAPELLSTFFIEHSIRFSNNYIATRLFYNRLNSTICNLTFVNDTSVLETRFYNLGTINQYGVQVTGAFKLGKMITVNPYLRVYYLITQGNDIAKLYEVTNRQHVEYESGLSTVVSFKHEFSLSLVFQYSSPKNNIQGNTFSDPLYFISFEKTFKHRLKAGVSCGLPFTRNFIYQGSEITGKDFYSYYAGNIRIPQVTVGWLKLSYQFNSGKKREKIDRAKEEIDDVRKKGF